jgi:L-amino acid N-acyltransferase YncA
VTPDNVEDVGIHCVENRKHAGRRAKIEWFAKEYRKGLCIRMLYSAEARKSVGFIEYAPGEHAWRAVEAPGYLVVHCIWVKSSGRGYGTRLVEAVVEHARRERKRGVAVVTSSGTWCAKGTIFEKSGFRLVEEREPFGLRVRKLERAAADPAFSRPQVSRKGDSLVFRYSAQCPFVERAAAELSAEAGAWGVPLELKRIETSRQARSAPTPYGVTSLTIGSKVLADHAISRTRFRNILRQEKLVQGGADRDRGGRRIRTPRGPRR